MFAERRERAMGSNAQVIVYAATADAAAQLADLALMRIGMLERCWSRFLPDSELSALNSRAGRGPVEVSSDLLALVSTMVKAHQWTQGACDPTVLTTMVSLGYDRSFDEVHAPPTETFPVAVPSSGISGVLVNGSTARLPVGLGLDPGAVGKGLAADIVVDELSAAGASGVLVNLGGDVCVRGTADGQAWEVGVTDDRQEDAPTAITLRLGGDRLAVATSSSLKRRWRGRHHIVDPATGMPSTSDIAQATCVAPTGWMAEAAATYALVRGSDRTREWMQGRPLDVLEFPHDRRQPHRLHEELTHA